MPLKKDPLPDAVTSASPHNDTLLHFSLPDSLKGRQIVLKMEVNSSFDYNKNYPEKEKESTLPYTGKANGQPSLLYEAILPADAESVHLTLVGCAIGSGGYLSKDLSGLTSAKSILKSATAKRGIK